MNVYWFEQSNGDVPVGDGWLSAAERASLDRLRIPKRRADWRLGRWTAKCAAAAYLNLECCPDVLAAVELRPAASGAPEVFVCARPAPVSISLSHSRGAGLCAIARAGAAVGCDLEMVEPRSPAFLADYFTGEEQALVAGTIAAGRDRLLTLLWSSKESTLKALGCGLRSDTRAVNVSLEHLPRECDDEWRPVSAVHTGGRTFNGWWRSSRNFIWTVVVDPPCDPPGRIGGIPERVTLPSV